MCSRSASALASDDWVWRNVLRASFPTSPHHLLAPTHGVVLGPGAWRWACMLEANGLASEPCCFHRKSCRFDQGTTAGELEVLGVGLAFTKNPKTGRVDYVASTFDVISFSAFRYDGVRRSLWGEPFEVKFHPRSFFTF